MLEAKEFLGFWLHSRVRSPIAEYCYVYCVYCFRASALRNYLASHATHSGAVYALNADATHSRAGARRHASPHTLQPAFRVFGLGLEEGSGVPRHRAKGSREMR